MKNTIRPLIALALAVPLYVALDFGWLMLSLVGLQFLAGIELKS